MKKIIKILIWVIGSIISIALIGVFVSYWWVSTEWKDHYSENEIKVITDQINNSKPISKSFYEAYDKVYPDQRKRSLNKMTFQAVWFFVTNNLDKASKYRNCNSVIAAGLFKDKKYLGYHSFDSYILAHGLIKFTSEEKCFDFIYNDPRTDQFSYDCYAKPLDKLTYNESIEFLIRHEKPTFYSQNPELLAKRILKYKDNQHTTKK